MVIAQLLLLLLLLAGQRRRTRMRITTHLLLVLLLLAANSTLQDGINGVELATGRLSQCHVVEIRSHGVVQLAPEVAPVTAGSLSQLLDFLPLAHGQLIDRAGGLFADYGDVVL